MVGPVSQRIAAFVSNSGDNDQYQRDLIWVVSIDVGGRPSGPSIEGPFCRTVHLCRTLGDRKIEKKNKTKRKIKKKEGKIEIREKEMRKKRKIAEILFIFYALLSF